jgi:hypothetical protein
VRIRKLCASPGTSPTATDALSHQQNNAQVQKRCVH